MSSELLPEWLNLILDDVETILCLPILLVMVLCTAQFVFNHTKDIGYTFYQNVIQKSGEDDEDDGDKEQGEGILSKIKGYICNLANGTNEVDVTKEENTELPKLRPNSQEEEWDYCEEDDD